MMIDLISELKISGPTWAQARIASLRYCESTCRQSHPAVGEGFRPDPPIR